MKRVLLQSNRHALLSLAFKLEVTPRAVDASVYQGSLSKGDDIVLPGREENQVGRLIKMHRRNGRHKKQAGDIVTLA
jgi:translation elongation factor EF-G